MMSSYQQLGLDGLRSDTQRVLEKNFPNSRFLSGGPSRANRAWWQFW
jgi:outer membrane protein assembly factor BamD